MANGRDSNRWRHNVDNRGCRFHLPMGEQSDGALMAGSISVVVNQFVQSRRRRHHVQQQHQPDQQNGQNRFAAQNQMVSPELQSNCILAHNVP